MVGSARGSGNILRPRVTEPRGREKMDIHSYVDMCTVGAKEENPFSLLEISSGAHNVLFLIVLVRERDYGLCPICLVRIFVPTWKKGRPVCF